MKFMKLFKTICLSTLVTFSSCTLDHYQDHKSLKIIAKFPGKSASNNGSTLSKPADASVDYVPPFVDRIEVVLSSDGNEERIYYQDRVENQSTASLSAEMNIGEIPYGTYTLIIKAYHFNSRLSDNPDTAIDERYIETHRSTISDWVAGSGFENVIVEANLDVAKPDSCSDPAEHCNQGIDLDKESPIKVSAPEISQIGIPTPWVSHCIDIDGEGNFAIAWFEQAGSINTIHAAFFDENGENYEKVSFPLGDIGSIYAGRAVSSCKLIDGFLYVPMYIPIEPYNGLTVIKFKRNNEPIVNLIKSGVFSYHHQPSIEVNTDMLVLIWTDGNSPSFLRIFDSNLNPRSDEFVFCVTGNCNDIRAKILDESTLIVTRIQSQDLGIVQYKITAGIEGFLILERNHSSYLRESFQAGGGIGNYSFEVSSYPSFIAAYDDGMSIVFDKPILGNAGQINMLFSDDQTDPFIMIPDSQSADQRKPAFVNSRQEKSVMSWLGTFAPSALYAWYYSVLDDVGPVQGVGNLVLDYTFDPSEPLKNYAAPRMAVNDDGFTVMSAFRTDLDEIHIKRFIF